MNIKISNSRTRINNDIRITGSKSESNRLLLLQALYPQIKIENLSNSDDSVLMQNALTSGSEVVDIHHAGTAMRFLTAFFATREGREVVLTGSKRMTERPIKILVDALEQLGAEIEYTQEEGYPPLKISGKRLEKNKVSLQANVSSQYISALLLVAPRLKNGLELTLEGKITSVPYIKMTLALLNEIGVETAFEGHVIKVAPLEEIDPVTLTVESDWSSASYFYSIAALCEEGTEISLSSYRKSSLQGDSTLSELYRSFGVETVFDTKTITLKKENTPDPSEKISFDLSNAPDIAQTIAVTCFGLGRGCHLTGLHTLKIKETDRLEALKTELSKLGASIKVTDAELFLEPSATIRKNIAIPTYNDHRMAMAFAPLGLKVPIIIEEAEVVSKSYPDFWKDMEKLDFRIESL
ncbi:3-phosphoshikimate 1-carboxyvinyltransferase [Sinomicrobium weinanense]|uniref:3-phosphoshikimate 1-carboxyvinyltransferase n=1 Tax=Sinomicrobium weinanense TaxID=2842200 RepID=A0A926Q3N5_9FLAO|nr:3-phosphoshikimate 1-carboxyvinyltransferase [Sinomicrobium weinanense]MBC9796181.1 3-phosphoshikimate 1-carboxyvinyltransferase [Sinomicrobium weinanense]MBU3123460.1 3-phosphoshikimate 1-carboxyvinyltransferase [Sinomicrobium weinanense]